LLVGNVKKRWSNMWKYIFRRTKIKKLLKMYDSATWKIHVVKKKWLTLESFLWVNTECQVMWRIQSFAQSGSSDLRQCRRESDDTKRDIPLSVCGIIISILIKQLKCFLSSSGASTPIPPRFKFPSLKISPLSPSKTSLSWHTRLSMI
jgi:hypothetical protein